MDWWAGLEWWHRLLVLLAPIAVAVAAIVRSQAAYERRMKAAMMASRAGELMADVDAWLLTGDPSFLDGNPKEDRTWRQQDDGS